MTAICGLVAKERDKAISREQLDKMCRPLLRGTRTPVGGHLTNHIGLGWATEQESRRTFFQDERKWVVCDAEIYNLGELLHELENRGCKLVTRAEPEVIAHLYEEYGEKAVEKIRGVFAFALWDEVGQSLLLATDRFGVRPLHYYDSNGMFIFGSKIKSIQACEGTPRDIDIRSIYSFLNYSFVPTPNTIFRGIKKLPPGHLLLLQNGQTAVTQYWDMSYLESGYRESVYKDRFLELIEEAVRIRTQYQQEHCDNVGAFLSGGTDSSTVIGMVAKATGQRPKSFSIGFGEDRYNETGYARIAAKHFNADHHEYFVTPQDTLDAIPLMVREYDEPFANSSVIPVYYCAKLAKEHGVDILLAGDGGDELFAGNERYSVSKLYSMYQRIPSLLRRGLIEPGVFGYPWDKPSVVDKARKYISRSNTPNPARFFLYEFFVYNHFDAIFTDGFLSSVGRDYPLEIAQAHYNSVQGSELNRLLYLDLKFTITDNDLRKVNRPAELAGVRVRYPFLDDDLAEFSGTIPTNLKLKRFKLRYLFKEALQGFLPTEILKKKKHGFGLPFGVWLKTEKPLQDLAYSTVLDPKSVQRGYFRREFLEDLIRRHQEDETSYYGDILWDFMVLELWHREHVDA